MQLSDNPKILLNSQEVTCLFVPYTGEFSKGYFYFWAVIAIAWGTIGSAVIIALPLIESWETIQAVILGIFTNDRLMEKVEELNFKEKTKKLEATEQQSFSLPM